MNYDLVIIGAGAAGTQAAFTGAALGLKTMLVEMGFAGGTCVNVGCIPTKFLLGSTAPLSSFATQKKLKGLQGEISADLPAIQERKNRYIKGLRSALEKRFKDSGVDFAHGRASFTGPNSLHVKLHEGEPADVSFKKCIIATGSTPASFPGLQPDGKNVLTSTGLLNLAEVPQTLIIVGGGVIGIELGEFYSRLGSKIIMVEAMERIALSEDAEISAAVHKQFTREGWQIHVSRRVKSVTSDAAGALLQFDDGEEIHADKAMIAVGRKPGSSGLDLEKAGVKTNQRGWIETDGQLLAAQNIYAVGDVNGRVLLAHAAEHQADYAVRHAAGKLEEAYDNSAMPSCIYGHFEMMHVGPSTAQLAEKYQGALIEVSRSQLIANPIAQSYGTTPGMVKVSWVDGKVHSIAAWGHGVSHLVGLATVIVKQHWPGAEMIFAHPTLDESIKSALLAPKQPI